MMPGDREAEIGRLISGVLGMRRAGVDVDFAAVAQEHAALMPQLGDRLRRLQLIADAARHDPTRTVTGDRSSSGYDPGEDLQFLRESLADGYDVLESIQYGGQGAVFKAIQRTTKRLVAIKVLLDGPLASRDQRRRFEHEVEYISRLRHPGLVMLYESGTVRGRQYLVTEYIDGHSIDDYVLLEGLSTKQIVRLMVGVCRAASEAHQRAIIHRDLKPANILVDREGRPYILDFGLAKVVNAMREAADTSSVSLPGQVVGTLPYLSPEQAAGDSEEVDPRSDIYALGVILFELLTGRFPYPIGIDRKAAIRAIREQVPPTVRAVCRAGSDAAVPGDPDSLSDDLSRVIAKALEKDKLRRYQSASEFADDLERFLTGDAVLAKAASRSYVLRKALGKFKVPVALGAVMLMIVLGSTISVAVLWRRAETAHRIAQAGLQAGGILKLGSVYRDEGRVDQAAEMFRKVAELIDRMGRHDPFLLRQAYDAHHRLAELYLETGRADLACMHVLRATELSRQLVAQEPNDEEWQRLAAFSWELRGRLHISHENWTAALMAYEEAARHYEQLVADYPAQDGLRYDQARALNLQTTCLWRLREVDRAHQVCNACITVLEDLVDAEPDVIDFSVELSRLQMKKAALFLDAKSPEDDGCAAEFLDRADAHVTALLASGTGKSRLNDLKELHEDIAQNQKLIERRLQRRASLAAQ